MKLPPGTASAAASREDAGRTIDGSTHRHYVRSPVDVLRLVVGAVLMAIGLVVAEVFDSTLLGLSEDGSAVLDRMPDWLRDVPVVALAVAMMAAVAGAVMVALVATRFRRFAMMASAFGAAVLLSVGIGDVIGRIVDEPVRSAFEGASNRIRLRELGGTLDPGDPLLAGSVAVVLVSASFRPRSVGRRLAIVVATYAVASVFTSGVPTVGLVADIGAGTVAASAALLAFGRHDLTPSGHEVRAALGSLGLRVDHVEPASAGTATTWRGRAANGERVLVEAYDRDERSADLLLRLARWVRFRTTGDPRPFVGLRRSVEHEARMSLQVAAADIPTRRVLGVADAGVDGMAMVFSDIDGTPADQVDEIDDRDLFALWSLARRLHERRIAHRDLRLGNFVVGPDAAPSVVGLGRAEGAATDELLGIDLAELLASTASAVGVERAVAAASSTLDGDELALAMPWLQPLALTATTRRALRGTETLAEIRAALVEGCGVAAEEPVELERVSGKTLFIIVTVGLSAWFLIPQFADIDNVWRQTRSASGPWVAAAVGFSVVTYVAATASLLGAIPVRLRFGPALAAQVASSFANRITPAKVGGYATNVRFFQRQGVPTTVSVTAVGVNAVAGIVVHLLLTLGFLLLASEHQSAGGLSLPSTGTIVVAFAVLAAIAIASVAMPVLRRLWAEHVVPQLRTGWDAIRTVGRSPTRLVVLFGGAAAITGAYLGAMVASLEAFGSDAAFPIVGLLFLTGSAVANAAPTPGGLGAAEAALIAAFSTVEETAIVIPAVFLFRLVTFWLPILPGWLALTYLRRTDRL